MTIQRSVLGPGLLTLDPTLPGVLEMSSQVTDVVFDPKADVSDSIPVLSGEIAPGDYTEAPTISGSLLPDFGQADSIQEWLFTNKGKTVTFAFTPSSSLASKITGHLVVKPSTVGGTVKKADTIDFEFQVLDYDIQAVYTAG